MSTHALIERINSMLPVERKIDAGYFDRMRAIGMSDAIVQHAILDRLESKLRTLDKGCVRAWADSWAQDIVTEDDFAVFSEPYASRADQKAARKVLVAECK